MAPSILGALYRAANSGSFSPQINQRRFFEDLEGEDEFTDRVLELIGLARPCKNGARHYEATQRCVEIIAKRACGSLPKDQLPLAEIAPTLLTSIFTAADGDPESWECHLEFVCRVLEALGLIRPDDESPVEFSPTTALVQLVLERSVRRPAHAHPKEVNDASAKR